MSGEFFLGSGFTVLRLWLTSVRFRERMGATGDQRRVTEAIIHRWPRARRRVTGNVYGWGNVFLSGEIDWGGRRGDGCNGGDR